MALLYPGEVSVSFRVFCEARWSGVLPSRVVCIFPVFSCEVSSGIPRELDSCKESFSKISINVVLSPAL